MALPFPYQPAKIAEPGTAADAGNGLGLTLRPMAALLSLSFGGMGLLDANKVTKGEIIMKKKLTTGLATGLLMFAVVGIANAGSARNPRLRK